MTNHQVPNGIEPKPSAFIAWVMAAPKEHNFSSFTTAADTLKKRAIDRWENEGGEIPQLIEPVRAPVMIEE